MSSRKIVGSRYTLRLPGWLLRRFSLELLLARLPLVWARGRELIECFALSEPERRFARALLERKPNLWIYRCNQRLFCGDFIVVDMSVPDPRYREAIVLELKKSGALRSGATGDERLPHQLNAASAAVAALAEDGVLADGSRFRTLQGAQDEVLAQLVRAPGPA